MSVHDTHRRSGTRATIAAADETLTRRTGVSKLHAMLTDRQARKADAVVPAGAIESRDGVLHVAGAIAPGATGRRRPAPALRRP